MRGYKEEGTITTYFDMTVLNDLDCFHLVMDVIHALSAFAIPPTHQGYPGDSHRLNEDVPGRFQPD